MPGRDVVWFGRILILIFEMLMSQDGLGLLVASVTYRYLPYQVTPYCNRCRCLSIGHGHDRYIIHSCHSYCTGACHFQRGGSTSRKSSAKPHMIRPPRSTGRSAKPHLAHKTGSRWRVYGECWRWRANRASA